MINLSITPEEVAEMAKANARFISNAPAMALLISKLDDKNKKLEEQNKKLLDLVELLRKTNKELSSSLESTLNWMEELRASGDAGNWTWQPGDEYYQALQVLIDQDRSRFNDMIDRVEAENDQVELSRGKIISQLVW